MYIPHHFAVDDLDYIRDFVASRAAADFVTVDTDGQPIATLMPCVWVPAEGDYGILVMHMARANNQWKSIADGDRALAIVHGEQAYVSPSYYQSKQEHGRVVPTWNYTSVHISGTVRISQTDDDVLEAVTLVTNRHEEQRQHPWHVSDAPDEFIAGQLKAIVAVTLTIDRVEAKAKISQNRHEADRSGVIAAFSESQIAAERHIASLMRATDNQLGR
jgi:transcriptional regulator